MKDNPNYSRHTQGIVKTEVETSVNDNAYDRWHKSSVKPKNAIGLERLLVDVDQAVELALSTFRCRLCVVRETRTSIIEGVNEDL